MVSLGLLFAFSEFFVWLLHFDGFSFFALPFFGYLLFIVSNNGKVHEPMKDLSWRNDAGFLA